MPRGQGQGQGQGRGRPAVTGFSNRPEAVSHRQIHRRDDGGVDDDLNREEHDLQGRQPRTRGGGWQEAEQMEEVQGDICLNVNPNEAYKLATVIKQAVDNGDEELEPLLNTLGQEIMTHFQGQFGNIEQFIEGPKGDFPNERVRRLAYRDAATRGGGPGGGRGRGSR